MTHASKITIRAKGGQTDVPVACSVDIGRAIYQAEAHKGVGLAIVPGSRANLKLSEGGHWIASVVFGERDVKLSRSPLRGDHH